MMGGEGCEGGRRRESGDGNVRGGMWFWAGCALLVAVAIIVLIGTVLPG